MASSLLSLDRFFLSLPFAIIFFISTKFLDPDTIQDRDHRRRGRLEKNKNEHDEDEDEGEELQLHVQLQLENEQQRQELRLERHGLDTILSQVLGDSFAVSYSIINHLETGM